ncbi:MAG: hypothetical protein NW218_15670, partial [Saprospiraceae bacterium]|nr:hypothetical protein [Saprospiraceae bacterium]
QYLVIKKNRILVFTKIRVFYIPFELKGRFLIDNQFTRSRAVLPRVSICRALPVLYTRAEPE